MGKAVPLQPGAGHSWSAWPREHLLSEEGASSQIRSILHSAKKIGDVLLRSQPVDWCCWNFLICR